MKALYGYDKAGRLAEVCASNGIRAQYRYDKNDLPDEEVVQNVTADEKIARFLVKQEGQIRKTIVIKNKLVNLIVK